MADHSALIKEIFSKNGLSKLLDAPKIEKLNILIENMLKVNASMNLTSITDPDEIILKHIADSATISQYIPQNARMLDVGTGAGFPGMVLKILRPDIGITLMDGLNKRLVFLDEVAKALNLEVKTVHLRAEEAGKNQGYRERFDLATARAVSRLNVLYEYCLPLVKVGGTFCAMKGPSAAEELSEAKRAGGILGGGKAEIKETTLTGEEKRCFVITKKISQTPPKYPRISAKISKQPL